MAAKLAEKCIGVDISPEACRLATLNAALNGASDIVEIKNGNLFEPVEGITFDAIYCNPPFLPVPDEVRFPTSGSGGPDGLDIVRRIWKEADRFLRKNGVGTMWFQALGNDIAPFWLGEFQAIARQNEWSVRILVSSRMPLSFQAQVVAETASTVNSRDAADLCLLWQKLYRDLQATFLYDCLLWFQKADEFNLEVHNLLSTWTQHDIPTVIETDVNSRSAANGRSWLARKLLAYSDGHQSVHDILQKLIERDPERLGRSAEKLLSLSLTELEYLERNRYIKHVIRH
ncbi:MAG: methyltransferase [Chloroflexi bacterium]|nr:methyltransferase [Chloroflexota bacterium]